MVRCFRVGRDVFLGMIGWRWMVLRIERVWDVASMSKLWEEVLIVQITSAKKDISVE